MKLSAAYGPGKFGLSFELFPPKTPQGEASLFQHVARLVEFRPSFITCTYGAGGSTQDTTLEIVSRVHREFRPAGGDASDVRRLRRSTSFASYLRRAAQAGIENVVALRGDPPRGDTTFRPVAGGLAHANELVQPDSRRVCGVWHRRGRLPGNASRSAQPGGGPGRISSGKSTPGRTW